jgi:hypothetical protein
LHRVVGGGLLLQPRQQGRLGQGQLAGVDAEVQLRGGLDAVDPLAEVGDVEVVVEDLLLAERLLQLYGVPELLDLAARGLPGRLREARGVGVAGVVDEDVLDVLLRQRRPALGGPGAGVVDQGAQRALQVDGPVLVVPVVLDVDQRVLHDRRDLVQRHDRAVLRVERRDHVALVVVDRRRLGEGREGEAVRDAVEVVGGGLGAEADRADGRDAETRDDRACQHACAEQAYTETDLVEGGTRAIRCHGRTIRGRFPYRRADVRLLLSQACDKLLCAP